MILPAYTRFFSLLLCLLLLQNGTRAQNAELVLSAGLANYQGDLQTAPFSFKTPGTYAGLVYRYPLGDHWRVRAGFGSSNITASDANNAGGLRLRNLNFSTQVFDGYIAPEFRLFTREQSAITPYAFAGAGIFRFNPYTTLDGKGPRIYLQPLGTEGQGLPEYPDRKMYRLTQVFVPAGGGVQWQAGNKIAIGLEYRQNITFTDYLDDVSTRYAREDALLRGRGQLAVNLAYRRDELDGRPYPTNEGIRGNPDRKDWYYSFAVNLVLSLDRQKGMGYFKSRNTRALGCPRW